MGTKKLMRVITCAGTFLLLACAPLSGNDERARTDCESATKSHLLQCALSKTAECKEAVLSVLDDDSEPYDVRALAKVIIDEWAYDVDRSALSRPKLVEGTFPTLEEVRALLPPEITQPLIVLSGKVNDEGTVVEASIDRPSRYPALDALVVERFRGFQYRPAVLDGEYVSAPVTYTYSVEVR